MMTVKHRAFVVGSYRLVQFWVYFSGRIFFVFGQKATAAYRYALIKINVFINLKLFNIWKTLITKIKEGREDTINHHQYTWYSISKQFCNLIHVPFLLSLSGTFKLTIEFTEEYPNKPPTVRFVSKMFHPNGIYQHTEFEIFIDVKIITP